MATRLDPKHGIVVIERAFGHGLNPSFPDYVGAKVGFDCCRAFPFRYEHDRAAYKKVPLAGVAIATKPIVTRAAASPAATGDAPKASGGQAM